MVYGYEFFSNTMLFVLKGVHITTEYAVVAIGGDDALMTTFDIWSLYVHF